MGFLIYRKAAAGAAMLAVALGWAGAEPAPPDELPEKFELPEVEPWDGRISGSRLPVGESLFYEIDWGLFHVANTVMTIHPPKRINGRPAYHVEMRNRTHGFADSLYRVDDEHNSYVAADFSRSLFYKKVQRGHHTRDTKLVFDWQDMLAQRTDWGRPWMENIPLKPRTFDPLSITFAFRSLDHMDVGDSFLIHSTDGKAMIPVDIRVRKREVVKTPMGRFLCYLVEPDTQGLRGVFSKKEGSNILIWFNVEPPYVPVKLKSAVAVGSFEAKLSNIEGPGREAFLATRVDRKGRRIGAAEAD